MFSTAAGLGPAVPFTLPYALGARDERDDAE